MKIGQVARKYGLSKDNIYYYINYGLLVPPRGGTAGSQYDFDQETLRDLEMILKLKELDYSLSDIHRMLSLRRISGLDNPEDRRELLGMYTSQRQRCVQKLHHYESVIHRLDERILNLTSRAEADETRCTGVPLSMLGLLCCPYCGRPLQIANVNMDMEYIYDADLHCSCGGDCGNGADSQDITGDGSSKSGCSGKSCGPGYRARIEEGILITPNGYAGEVDKPDVGRELYKDLPPSLISLFQRSYNYMTEDLRALDLSGRVVMETYVTAWFFLHNHQQFFTPGGYYIVVDKFPETLAMYKDLIDRESYHLPILYLADSSRNYPLKQGSVDLNIDFFAVNEHNFYSDTFLLDELAPYMKKGAHVLGTYFCFDNGARSMKNLLDTYPQASTNNFSLPWFRQQIDQSGIRLDHERLCGSTTDSGNNLGFGFHQTGEKLSLVEYFGRMPE